VHGNLVFALERMKENGLLSERLTFLIGQNPKIPVNKRTFSIAVGECASSMTERISGSMDVLPRQAQFISALSLYP